MSNTIKERCDEFERVSKTNLTGPTLIREIESLRKFLYKHQDEHLSRYPSIFSAIISHSLNPAALQDSKRGTDSILLGLLDDCLALPERVITGSQKMKILQKRERELGRNSQVDVSSTSAGIKRQVIDIDEDTVTVLIKDGSLQSFSCSEILLQKVKKIFEEMNDTDEYVYVYVDEETNSVIRLG
jgi:hypothetical protein